MPYWMDGGSYQVAITGDNQLLLSIAFFIYPESTSDQLCGFINVNGGDIYDKQQITEQCNQLEVSRKIG